MLQRIELNRRSFLRTAGMTALAGAVGTNASMAAAAPSPTVEPPDGTYDFDEIYDRTGTHCSKWDSHIKTYGKENIEVAMGVAVCYPGAQSTLRSRELGLRYPGRFFIKKRSSRGTRTATS